MTTLAHALVTAPGRSPDRWIAFFHGILGSGANWRSFARRLTDARPGWGAVLFDLRLHGGSLGLPPPHTVRAAVEDVERTSKAVPGPVRAVVGHSFGGKVALAFAERTPLDHVFVVDSTPGARPDHRGSESTLAIVEMLMELPSELASRDEFLAFVEKRGVTRDIAMWLAMNVRPVPGTTKFVFRIDVPAVKQMLDDYFALDLWHVVGRSETHLVVGGRSTVVDEADRERARSTPRTTVDVIPDAGHWVHADKPDELLGIVLRHLS